ncbi:MAG: hypothetical protein GC154_10145 [bacterium]|nr:hypothetical protein [bacterium]
MARKRSEKLLFIVVLLLAAVFGGSYLYQNVDTDLLFLQSNVDEQLSSIESMQSVLELSPRIQARYDAMESELKLGLAGAENEKRFNDMSNSEQELQIRGEITQILSDLGLKDAYGNITSKEPSKEEDFKIVSIDVNQLQCTPKQLGELLYRLEKQSEVMEVESCRIDNLIDDRGGTPRMVEMGGLDASGGLLSVDLKISRLVEYRKGEAPKKRGRA